MSMTLLETIRYAASRKSSLDRDQKLLTDAAAELERLTRQLAEARAEAELWHSRCISAVWLIPGDVTLGQLQEAAKEAAELRKQSAAQETKGPRPDQMQQVKWFE